MREFARSSGADREPYPTEPRFVPVGPPPPADPLVILDETERLSEHALANEIRGRFRTAAEVKQRKLEEEPSLEMKADGRCSLCKERGAGVVRSWPEGVLGPSMGQVCGDCLDDMIANELQDRRETREDAELEATFERMEQEDADKAAGDANHIAERGL